MISLRSAGWRYAFNVLSRHIDVVSSFYRWRVARRERKPKYLRSPNNNKQQSNSSQTRGRLKKARGLGDPWIRPRFCWKKEKERGKHVPTVWAITILLILIATIFIVWLAVQVLAIGRHDESRHICTICYSTIIKWDVNVEYQYNSAILREDISEMTESHDVNVEQSPSKFEKERTCNRPRLHIFPRSPKWPHQYNSARKVSLERNLSQETSPAWASIPCFLVSRTLALRTVDFLGVVEQQPTVDRSYMNHSWTTPKSRHRPYGRHNIDDWYYAWCIKTGFIAE